MNEFTFSSPFIFVQIKLRRLGGESDEKIERKCKAEAQIGERNGKAGGEGCGAAAVNLSGMLYFGRILLRSIWFWSIFALHSDSGH